MKALITLAKQYYWGNGVGLNFKLSFARKFKNELTKQLHGIGATITEFSVGHYYVSGFFRIEGKCYYFSISDVRHFELKQMLWRTAKDEKDFTGGQNRYVQLNEELGRTIRDQVYMDKNKISFLLID